VQFGHRVALIGIAVKQNGHSLVDGGAGGGTCLNRLICLTNKNITKATIRKSIIVLINIP
jgi:hypothetical protein